MHSYIIQLSSTPYKSDKDWMGESAMYEYVGYYSGIDYVDTISDEERAEVIELFKTKWLPSQLFEPGEGDSVIFKGKEALRKYESDLAEEIADKAYQVQTGQLPFSKLKPCVDNPLKMGMTRFVIDDYCSVPEFDAILYDMLHCLKDNTVLYVGGILDYHW